MNPMEELLAALLGDGADDEPREFQEAYDDFEERSRHIWEGENRALTREECHKYAAETAEKFGLDWNDNDGIEFVAKAPAH